MLKISFGPSPVISTQFTLDKCVAATNREKNRYKPLVWGSTSFKVIDAGTPGKLVSSAWVMMRSKSVSVCNRSLARLDDSSRNRAF